MKRAIYRLPSTFTYLGRHASELRFLLGRAKKKGEILDIGPGPFEPFYISRLSPDSRLTVVDLNPTILQMIRSIEDGIPVPLTEAAKHCHNVQNDGSPRTNRDLILPERIRQGLDELAMAGVDPNDFVNGGDFVYRGRSNILTMKPMDIVEAMPWKRFDVVFEGLVLLNLSKTLGKADFEKTIRTLGQLTNPDGVLGIGTTPAGISGDKGYLHLLMKVLRGRLQLQELIVDNLVDGGSRGLAGGYLATFSNQLDSPVFYGDLRDSLMQEDLLRGTAMIHPYVDEKKLLSLLNDPQYVLLAALNAGGQHYHTIFAKMDGLDIPSKRYQFRVMASLK